MDASIRTEFGISLQSGLGELPKIAKPTYIDRYNRVIASSVDFSRCNTYETYQMKLKKAGRELRKIRVNNLSVLILRITNFTIKLFNKKYEKIDNILTINNTGNFLIRKFSEIQSPKTSTYTSLQSINEHQVISQVKTGIYQLQLCQFGQFRDMLRVFNSIGETNFTDKELTHAYKQLPPYFKKIIGSMAELKELPKPIDKHLRGLVTAKGEYPSVLGELDALLGEQIGNYAALIQQELNLIGGVPVDPTAKKAAEASIAKNDQVFCLMTRKESIVDDRDSVYNVSVDRIARNDDAVLNQPITVTMVGIEYAGLIKQGGLAEAVEGMSRGLLEQCPGNRVKLVFPYFSHIPTEVKDQLTGPEVHTNSKGEEYQIYTYELDGVECYFIEHPSFQLVNDKPDIYGPNQPTQAARFAVFTELAADLIYEQDDTDIIHLHDWHVAGVALKLRRDHQQEWEDGEIPPIFFTYHNNNRLSQGRVTIGSYSYDPVVKGYQNAGIVKNNENLFVETLMYADGISTVSETFGLESQQLEHGHGVSFAVKRAAKVGKLTGIANGTDTTRWNAQTNPSLLNWQSPRINETDPVEQVDLTFDPLHPDAAKQNIVAQKHNSKVELQKWVAKYAPDVSVDFSKPLVTYIGRFDSTQKGLDKLEEAIDATLRNGGQFVCMGTAEDEDATALLDRLQNKYRSGVFFIRDYKDPNGKLHYQQGSDERPGIGPLVRAATDFIFIPSKFEPCGLVQYEGWLFGSLAIGSDTGGIADTIITAEKDPAKFNGFLFKRDGNKDQSAGQVIENALRSWAGKSDTEKNTILSRIITDGKQYKWTTAPQGYSPVEKYRFAYENARQRIGRRKTGDSTYNKVEALKNRILLKEENIQKNKELTANQKEEIYLYHYYQRKLDSQDLHDLYMKLPIEARAMVPAPYGVNVNFSKHETYGAFPSAEGTTFRVAAPNARRVSLVLIGADGKSAERPMMRNGNGDWEIRTHAPDGQRYQYKINGKLKLDPYGKSHTFFDDKGKKGCSMVADSRHVWSANEADWIKDRIEKAGDSTPMSIYELHPTLWKKNDGQPLNYRELAQELVTYCQNTGYTHVELMSILEHGNEQSWGYQVSGYFAANSRLGTTDDFKYLVDYLHQHQIGIILDWIPAHFEKNDLGLLNFDGSKMYEANGLDYLMSIRKIAFSYGSKHFDFSKKEVREFLISSATYWLKEMHIDGLRVDCVRSLLSTEDYHSADLFMRDLNAVVHKQCRGAITIAEEYSGDINITSSPYKEGYDFDMKWNVNWMHQLYSYIEKPFNKRTNHFELLKNAVDGDNWHKQIMFFSHDQFRKTMDSLLYKTPGIRDEDRLANIRTMLSFMMCLPGKKLVFMGADMADEDFWGNLIGGEQGLINRIDPNRETPQNLQEMMTELNSLYTSEKALYELDDNGFDKDWIPDPSSRIHAYRRVSAEGDSIACFHNFTGEDVTEFTVRIRKTEGQNINPNELFNSDDMLYGGQDRLNAAIALEDNGHELVYKIRVPPLSTVMVKEGKFRIEEVQVYAEEPLIKRRRIRSQMQDIAL